MVADFQTSMKEIREANLAFISLLVQLKRFISDKGTVAINVGGTEHTLPTIPSIIEAYRGGNFDEIVLKSGTSEVHLKNSNGTLQILDKNGNLVPLEVAKLKYAALANCAVSEATVQECAIDVLQALGGISVNHVDCQSLTISDLFTAASGLFQSFSAILFSANTAIIQKLFVRSILFNPATPINIFAAQTPYGYNANNDVFDDVSGGNHAYVCNPTQAEILKGWKSPDTMGFVEWPTDTTARKVLQAPDMMTFQGTTKYSDVTKGKYLKLANTYVIGTGTYGTMPAYPAVAGIKGPGGYYCGFGYLLGWPIRSFIKVPPSDASLPAVMRTYPRGAICLHEFSAADIGRIIYIRTFGNSWKIPRRLVTTYENGVLQSGVVDLEFEIPPYTALRLRLARYSVVDGTKITYHNVMELT